MRVNLILLLFFPLSVFSQVPFWTEDFGAGCNQGQLATSYGSPNGSWTVLNTGTNASFANVWYVSAAENGNLPGECGTGCGSDRSLHVGSVSILGLDADPGAAYYEGLAGLCGIFPCGQTDKRIQSPSIDCSGKSNITLDFHYIEGGNTQDNATLWYFNGTTWSQIANMSKTFSGPCNPQGLWTNFNIMLPASADNNSLVRIGFRWTNNEDGQAIDPSVAIDDITLSAVDAGDTTPPTVECPASEELFFDGTCNVSLPDYTIGLVYSDNEDPNPIVEQSPLPGTIFNDLLNVVISVTDAAGNTTVCNFGVEAIDIVAPEIICTDSVGVYAGEEIGIYVQVPLASATDDCSSFIIGNSLGGGDDASAFYEVGITEVIFTATDSYGNSSTCTTSIHVLTCCPADFNCDGSIGVTDLLFLIGNIGTTCEFSCSADLTGDNLVGVNDQLYFLGVFGTFCP